MAERKSGIKAAIETAGLSHTQAAANSGGSAPAQASFFAAPEPIDDGEPIDRDSRGAGRPPGATNKRTGKMAALLQAKGYKHPLLFLAEIYSEDPKVLARNVGCALIDALDLQRKAAAEALPYFESRMPVSVELPDGVVPIINIGALDVTPRGEAPRGMSIDDVEEDQALSGDGAVRPIDHPSHDPAKPLDDQENSG